MLLYTQEVAKMPVTPTQLRAKAQQEIASKLTAAVRDIDEKLVKSFNGQVSSVTIHCDYSYTHGLLFKEIQRIYGEYGWNVRTESSHDPRDNYSSYSLVFTEKANPIRGVVNLRTSLRFYHKQ
jgi:hypothetical protein